MKIEGTQELHAPRDRVYSALTDPEVLRRCIPGCESLEKTAADTYAATLKAGVGSIKGTFKGEVRLEDMRPPEHYRIVVEGKGGVGFAKGSADFDLEEKERRHPNQVLRRAANWRHDCRSRPTDDSGRGEDDGLEIFRRAGS